MGKCVSKDQQLQIKEIDERCYIAIDEFEYYHYEDEGQSESKKSSKKMGPETRGTSISFGFKKKIYNSSANKKLNINNNNNNGTKEQQKIEYEEQKNFTIISNNTAINAEQNLIITGDDNGNNTGPFNTDKETGRSTTPIQPRKREQTSGTTASRSNRFGFRQNVVRPASGITPKFSDFDSVNNNNASIISGTDKRRSKSASTARNVTISQSAFNNKNEPRSLGTIIDDVKQNTHEQSTANINNNSIVRPTLSPSQTVVLSKYTLHSTSLPRPQYPVPVSFNSAPTYNRSTTFTSLPNQRPPIASNAHVQSKLIDTKGAKHAANLHKRGGMMGRRDESCDSGIASHESTSERNQMYQSAMLSRQPRQRSRHFELIMNGRHKFEIRDLQEFTEDHQVVPLSLPKLPTDRKEIVTGGLIRSTNGNSYNTDTETDMSISYESNTRPASFISTASEAESYEEEKLKIDNSSSEKSLKGATIKESSVSSSSPSSSKNSFYGNAGESMATKNCSSVSFSSSDEDRKSIQIGARKKDIDCDDDELSSVTLTVDHSSYLNTTTIGSIPTNKDQKETVNDAFMRQNPKMGSISRKELFIHMDDFKFAEIAEAAKDSVQLDDETSPTDSLVSSSESGDILMKKSAPKMNLPIRKPIDDLKEQDLEDITPELISPMTGTPTHASNSLSLSDGGRDDFLIDDEIADQPALVFNDKRDSPSLIGDRKNSSITMNITSDTTTTPTLREFSINTHGSLKSLNKALQSIKSDQSSPASNRKFMQRAESLDTLSPCDSIASDDLMGDFDVNSSLDSIDRVNQSHDDLRNNSERDSVLMKEYDAIMRIQQQTHRRNSSRESMTSQLPARATRLLNRRLQNTSNSPLSQNGSDSPRSLDSVQSRNTPSSKTSLRDHLKQRQQQNLQSQLINSSSEDLVVLDKSLTNSMLQDVVCFRKQLVHLRRILQETDTLNPFEVNGQIFNNVNGNVCENSEKIPSDKAKKDDENNVVLTNEQLNMIEDQRQELVELRRQVVFLQSQMDDKDRTIRIQQNMLEQYEKDKSKQMETNVMEQDLKSIETANCATQTERLRPVSMGQDNLTSQTSSKDKEPSGTKQNPAVTVKPSLAKSKTQISSIYTKLSSIKPTSNANKGSSIPNYSKPVKTTQIGASATPIQTANPKSPTKRIPQLLKMPTKTLKSFKPKPDDSNGNSATSSLSTSSSNSSLNNNTSNYLAMMKNELNEIYKNGRLD